MKKKNHILLLLLLVSIQLTGQNGSIQGKIQFKLDSTPLPGGIVVIEGTRKGAQADIEGNYELKNLKEGKYNLIFEYLGYGKDTIFNIRVDEKSITTIDLELPPGPCFKKSTSGKCPIDNKTKNVIPIVYGLPDKKIMRKAEKGKLKLGGCEVTGCEPYWYCGDHKIEF